MAILFLDGFEVYSSINGNNQYIGLSDVYTPANASTFDSLITVGDMTSGAYLPGTIGSRSLISQSSPSTINAAYFPVSNLTNICVGMHFKVSSNNGVVFNLGNSNAWSSNRLGIFINSTGLISLYKWDQSDPDGTSRFYTTDVDPIALNTWYFIELRVQVLGRSVNAWVYKNGKMIANINNVIALSTNTSFQNIDRIAFGYPPNGSGSATLINYDNFYVTDGNVLGPIYIAPLLPSADTIQKDWGSTGTSNYNQLNELTGATIINRAVSTSVGDVDFYDHNPININDGIFNILGIQSATMYSTDSESGTEFTVNLDTGTNEVQLDSITVPIGIDYNKQFKRGAIITTNPDTSSQFQISELNNSKIGLERTS